MKLSKLLSISVLSISTLLTGCKPSNTVETATPIVGGEREFAFDLFDEDVAYTLEIYENGCAANHEGSGAQPLSSSSMSHSDEERVSCYGVSISFRRVDALVRASLPEPDLFGSIEEFVFSIGIGRMGDYYFVFNINDLSLNYGPQRGRAR